MTAHILDRPLWSTLSTRHQQLSIGDDRARRFEVDISPFAAAPDDSDECLSAIAALVDEGDGIVLAQVAELPVPPGLTAVHRTTANQMILDDSATPSAQHHPLLPLGDDDASEMLALAELTRPGPFRSRTGILGDFFGIRDGGRLVAMAGERFKQPGYTEISGVCTDPGYLGRGYAKSLCVNQIARIRARGETPYLHVYSSNTGAIRLYESLGFRTRTVLHVLELERPVKT